ncbi:MAG: hypothetical protein ACLFQV_09590 [Vulcanimicrobiota bacterium]
MKQFYHSRTRFIAVLIFSVIFSTFCSKLVFAEEMAQAECEKPPKPAGKDSSLAVGPYYWQENDTNNVLVNYYYLTVKSGLLDSRLDFIDLPQANKNYQRLRLHYGKLDITKSDTVVVFFQPGGMIDTEDRFYYGGKVTVKFPKMGLSACQKSYAGNKSDFHQTFVTQKLHKNFSIMYYRYAQKNVAPKSAVGPRVDIGDFYAWYGFSTNSRKMNFINVGAQFKF